MKRTAAKRIRHLIEIGSQPHAAFPLAKLASACANLDDPSLTIDLAAARQIGVPVLVLRTKESTFRQVTLEKLSVRERDVARLIAKGFNNAQISSALGIAVGTVKDHVHHALAKTGAKSRTELAATLVREGV